MGTTHAKIESQLQEKTSPANGVNPEALAEAQTAQAAADALKAEKAAKTWAAVGMGLLVAGMNGQVTSILPVNVTVSGKQIPVPVGTEIRPMQKNGTGTHYRVMIMGVANVKASLTYDWPILQGEKPTLNIPGEVKTRGTGTGTKRSPAIPRNVDAVESAMIEACKKVGHRNPIKKDGDGKVTDQGHFGDAVKNWTAEDWRKAFPGCTVGNLADAFIAIETFRADRAASLTAATTDADRATAMKAYRRAKSYEQEICSIGSSCDLI